jgi:hypothetical protein
MLARFARMLSPGLFGRLACHFVLLGPCRDHNILLSSGFLAWESQSLISDILKLLFAHRNLTVGFVSPSPIHRSAGSELLQAI